MGSFQIWGISPLIYTSRQRECSSPMKRSHPFISSSADMPSPAKPLSNGQIIKFATRQLSLGFEELQYHQRKERSRDRGSDGNKRPDLHTNGYKLVVGFSNFTNQLEQWLGILFLCRDLYPFCLLVYQVFLAQQTSHSTKAWHAFTFQRRWTRLLVSRQN